jgi:RNA polymerase sigma-70 factor, ECF subfamily
VNAHFDRLAKAHKDAVYRQMVRVCGNYDDAEDALVEALLAAYRALPKLRDESNFKAWLATVGRRACSRIKKREALHPVLSIHLVENQLKTESETSLLDDAQGAEEMAQWIKAVVASLPKNLQEVYSLREISGKSGEETARELGISLAAVKSRLHRARALVREALDSRNLVLLDESFVGGFATA